MAAPVLKLYPVDEKKEKKKAKQEAFIPPTEEQVIEYTMRKYQWPKAFAEYFAENFINHYAARGWRYVGNIKMASWPHGVGTWKNLRFAHDAEKLAKCKKEDQTVNLDNMDDATGLSYLDKVLMMYKTGWKPERADAEKIYTWLKGRNMFNLPPESVSRARISAGNRMDSVWMFELKEFFELMIKYNYTFTQWGK
jgi:hypothetical protein